MRSLAQHTDTKAPSLTLLELAGKFGIIIAISVLLGLVLPGWLAMKAQVFWPETMKLVVEAKHPELVSVIEGYDARQTEIRKSISALDEQIAADPQASARLAGLKQAYATELRKSAPISVQPFYLHIIMYFWPIMYFGLGSVAFVLRPPLPESMRFFSRPLFTFATTLCLWTYILAPLVFRTEAAKSAAHGRKVFAYSNPDISLPSHIAQLSNFGLMAFLLAIIWVEWSAWSAHLGSELDKRDLDKEKPGVRGLDQLSTDLLRWQATFLCLSFGFVTYTAIFWDQIIINNDYRFGFEALDIHLLWLATVVFTAAPLAMRWHRWQIRKIETISQLVNSGTDADIIKAKLEAIRELQPIGKWNLTASGFTVIASFAAPVIQALIKKSVLGGDMPP